MLTVHQLYRVLRELVGHTAIFEKAACPAKIEKSGHNEQNFNSKNGYINGYHHMDRVNESGEP
jgi:hypothetical protein